MEFRISQIMIMYICACHNPGLEITLRRKVRSNKSFLPDCELVACVPVTVLCSLAAARLLLRFVFLALPACLPAVRRFLLVRPSLVGLLACAWPGTWDLYQETFGACSFRWLFDFVCFCSSSFVCSFVFHVNTYL